MIRLRSRTVLLAEIGSATNETGGHLAEGTAPWSIPCCYDAYFGHDIEEALAIASVQIEERQSA